MITLRSSYASSFQTGNYMDSVLNVRGRGTAYATRN